MGVARRARAADKKRGELGGSPRSDPAPRLDAETAGQVAEAVCQGVQLPAGAGGLVGSFRQFGAGGIDIDDVAVEIFGHRVLLFGGGGDMGIHIGYIGDRGGDDFDAVARLLGALHAQPDHLLSGLCRLYGLFAPLLQGADDAVDLLGRLLSALGQRSHLIGHDRKTAPLFTRPSRLDGGVEG